MKLIDISRTMQESALYPGSAPAKIERLTSIATGSMFNVSMITADSHVGTHADACTHVLNCSPYTIDKMPLACFYGPCQVVTFSAAAAITLDDVRPYLTGCERLVLRTGGQGYLTMEAATAIAESDILTVVTDALSVASLREEAEIHRALLDTCTAVVENVVLDHVPDGRYILSAFPIKYGGCDGAPVRAVLLQDDAAE